MKMIGCVVEENKVYNPGDEAKLYCNDCIMFGDPGTCLAFRIHNKRDALIKTDDGKVVTF